MNHARGFTLIELMVAVAIVGLIAALAFPAYQESVRKANRADAQITLSRLATLQEQFYFRNNQYTSDFANLLDGATSGAPIDSDEGFYSIALSGGGTSWTMTATAQGGQASDSECARIILNSLGNRTAQDAGGNASTVCW